MSEGDNNSRNNIDNIDDRDDINPNYSNNMNEDYDDDLQPEIEGNDYDQENENNEEEGVDIVNENDNLSVQDYEEEQDFPVYANRLNKKMNEIIKNYKKVLKKVSEEIEENRNMVKILDEHMKSVEQQVKNKEMINEITKENTNLEKHTIQTVERQVGKLNTLKKTLEDQEVELQERFNSIQHNIIRANGRMDKHKMTMKDKQEELEQWALAARQKEDDHLNLEKYLHHDNLKIKEHTLFIEKLTLDVNKKSNELEREVTETQAAQIEMEKTTEELKRLQVERQDLLEKLLKTEEQIKQRHEELKEECDKYFNNKTELTEFKSDLDNKVKTLNENIKLNKSATEELKKRETDLFKTRDQHGFQETSLKDIHNDIEIKKNELSALAKELSSKTSRINFLKNELENKRKSLDEAKAYFNNKKNEIASNENVFLTAKEREKFIVDENKRLEYEAKKTREELEKRVNELYDKSKLLFDLREQEANMIGEINNIISARKNIKANITKLGSEITKQQELLYNVDFQIQLMERKVAWVQGKRTQEETNEINKEIEQLEKNKIEEGKKLTKLQNSLKMIDEDLRAVETQLKSAKEDKKKLTEVIEEMELENMKCGQDLQKISRKKEDVLVQHDIMKLEIKKLYDRLINEANEVFKNENQLYQLELCIKERETEIMGHKEILVAEHKAAESERHTVAMELSQKLTRANNLKLKYESIVQRNKKSSGDDEGVGEHSQAYYVIKTAQEKEELQRQKGEMDGKIKKCKKDLQSLYQTMTSLKDRNEKLKTSLIVEKTGEMDRSKKRDFEIRLDKESKEMWERKNELEKINYSIQEGEQNYREKDQQNLILRNNIEEFETNLKRMRKEVSDKEDKFDRSQKRNIQVLNAVKVDMANSDIGFEIELNNQMLRNKFLKNALTILCNEIPEMKFVLSNNLQEVGIDIPSRPVSEKGSESSKKSIR